MRNQVVYGLLGLTFLLVGCSEQTAAPVAQSAKTTPAKVEPKPIAVPAPVPAVMIDFAGTNSFTSDPHATNLVQITSEPAVQKKLGQILDTFAGNAPRLLGGPVPGKPDPARLRPLLNDLVSSGFVLCRFHSEGQPASWVLRPRAAADRAEAWKKNLAAWLSGSAPTAITNLASGNGWTTKADEQEILFINLKGGPTFALGPIAKEIQESLSKDPSFDPVPASKSAAWLHVQADQGALNGAASLTRSLLSNWIESATGTQSRLERGLEELGALDLSVTLRDGYVRTQAELKLTKPSAAPEAWLVPTNSIQDPLISFSGFQAAATPAQRLLPWLAPVDFTGLVGLDKEPGQIFAWGLGDVPFQSYIALPLKDSEQRLGAFSKGLEQRWGDYAKQRSLGQIKRDAASGQISWVGGLPMAVPFIAPSRDAGYVTGGIFPMAPGTNSMPRELLGQIQARENLVYYNWEITQGRLVQWKLLGQLLSMTRAPAKGEANAPVPALPMTPAAVGGGAWLNDLGKHLGNSVTEITAKSPTELALTRKSHSGFTALEWVLIDNWISNPGFPMFDPVGASAPVLPSAKFPKAPQPPAPPAFPAPPKL